MTSTLHNPYRVKISQIRKNCTWWWLQHWRWCCDKQTTTGKRSVSQSPQGQIAFFWSLNIFDLVDLMIKFRDFSGLNWTTTTFRIQSFGRSVRFQIVRFFPSSENNDTQKSSFCEDEDNEIITFGECVWHCILNKLKEEKNSGFRARFQSVLP